MKKTVSKLLTEKELCALTSLSLAFFRNLRSKPGADPLPFIKIGGRVRYSEADLHDWLERRRVYDCHQALRLKDAG